VGSRARILSLAWIAAVVAFAASAPQASARQTHLFLEEFGSAAKPSLIATNGLAVDQSTGDLLVIDSQAMTVSRYNPDGTPADFSALGTNVIDAEGGGECPTVPADCDQTPQNGFSFTTFQGEQQVAVDDSGTATDGDIYVTQSASHVVDIFGADGKYLGQLTNADGTPFSSVTSPCGAAVDPSGNLFVATGEDGAVYKYVPSANPPVNTDSVATFTAVNTPCNLAAGAAASAGSLFVNTFFTFQANSVLKLDGTTGALQEIVDPGEERLVAVDPSTGHVYAASGSPSEGVKAPIVSEYDASGSTPTLVSTFLVETPAKGMAIDAASGRVYLSSGVERISVYGPIVTVPDVVTGAATITGDTSATLNGTVNPEETSIEECVFEYGTTTAYGSTAPCEAPSAAEISGSSPVAVHADVAGLATETLYHYRLVAKNSNARIKGLDRTFKTPSKPTVLAEWASQVTADEATVKATINPGNAATTFRIEWGLDTSYGQSTGESPVGSDDADHTVSTALEGLSPGVTYHWRAVATNSHGAVPGPDRAFTTFSPHPRGLPDGRAYELVSPSVKDGGEVGVPTGAGGGAEFSVQPQQASPSGEKVTYSSFTAFGEEPESAPAASQYLSARGPGGWSTQNIDPRFEEGYLRDPFVGFSSALSRAASIVIEPPLTADATSGFPNLYVRDNDAGTLAAITTEDHQPKTSVPKSEYCLAFGGASSGFDRIAFAALGGLNEGDPTAKGFNLYEWSAGEGIKLVSRLPGTNAPASPKVTTGFGQATGDISCNASAGLMRHAISADGSRVFWTFGGTFLGAKEPLFARVEGNETIQLDKPQGLAGSGGEGKYWDASGNGAKVFFTDTQKLTTASTASGLPDLYRYDFEAPIGTRLSNLSVHAGEAANVLGVIGASEDGSYVYFVARAALTATPNPEGDVASPEADNLYVWHEGEVRFIATLAEGDHPDWDADPRFQSARVTPDGAHLAFMSRNSPTGYDNTVNEGAGCELGNFPEDSLSGSPQCAEAYLYDFAGDSLVCASCNPSGSRPLGPTRVPSWSTPYQQPRYLSDDGSRLFFETADALDLNDTNGKRDVYEFEREGVGGCGAGSATFSAASNGCLHLLSSGESDDDAYLLDASGTGDDAFLSTRQPLVFIDEDERFDVYDARVGGSSPSPPPKPCEGQCPEGGTSAPPIPSLGSSNLQGTGNPPPSRECPKGTRKQRRHGKVRCVKRKKHHRAKGRRARRGGGSAR
jgi:hypothetical protein